MTDAVAACPTRPRLAASATNSAAERSGGEYELKEATMYSSVRRLEADGDIEWYWGDETQGGRRKYFRITEKGKSTYANNKSNWEYAKRVLDNLL